MIEKNDYFIILEMLIINGNMLNFSIFYSLYYVSGLIQKQQFVY
jgi:hypothetical protein